MCHICFAKRNSSKSTNAVMAEANVKNIEAIEEFADAISHLRTKTRKQVDEINEQFQRVSAWIDRELPDYWKNEFRKAEKRWVEAREDLLRCESKTRSDDERSCSVQRKLLAKATERRRLCEERVRSLPQLSRTWEQFLQETSGTVRHLDDLSESTLQTAWVRLQGTLEAIRKYLEK